MPFSDIFASTFKNDTEYRQLIIQTAMALQTNKFIQVRVTKKNCQRKHQPSNKFGENPCWINARLFKDADSLVKQSSL